MKKLSNNSNLSNYNFNNANNGYFGVPLQTHNNGINNNVMYSQNTSVQLTQEKRSHIPRPNKFK